LVASRVQAKPFTLGAVGDIELGNDTQVGPNASSNGTGLGIRDISTRRRVVLISYDISALKDGGQFSSVRFSHFSHDLHGQTNVYGVVENQDLLEVESLTWNTAPGVQNNPTPPLDSPVELDPADLTDVLLTFGGPGQTGVRFSTDTSKALADFLNSDKDGIITFLFAPSAENAQLIVRSSEHAAGGSFLEGELSPIIGVALNPNPVDGATDVVRDVVLSWTPGQFADKHNVYLGTDFNDVNSAGPGSPHLVGPAHDANSYDAGHLEFGQTYYWRVDEVNAPLDSTVFRGPVWSFVTEPLAIPIPGASITAAGSSQTGNQGPENTLNGSGLDGSGLLHGVEGPTVWLSDRIGVQPTWIEFQFDRVHQLHEMWVWNANESLEPLVGLGFKDVTIEYSANGVDFVRLGTTHEFAQGPGTPNYAHNTTVDLSGVAAKYVRLTPTSNWGGVFSQYGLSEVRFFSIPVFAREPSPDSAATDVDVDVTLGWRAGRQAARHDVHVGADPNALTLAGSVTQPILDAASLGLALGQSYYWRVDEANDAQPPTTWQGDLWSFSTREFLVVDDFEDYNEFEPSTVYNTWKDGFANPTANGSAIGYLLGNPQETQTVHGGSQSVPLMYNNTTATFSEASVNANDLAIGRDWTVGVPTTLVLWFHGRPANATTERMYVKINGSKVVYGGDAIDVARPQWAQWNIDLAAFGVTLGNVTTLSIGFERTGAAGGTGTIFIDDIRLYRQAPPLPGEVVWVEAETGTVTAPTRLFDDPNASGGRYVSTEPGTADAGTAPPYPSGTVSIPFTVKGGIYTLRFRIGFPGGDDSCWVRIPDATTQSPVHSSGWVHFNDIPTGDFWHWSQQVKSEDQSGEPPVEFTLAAGTHTLEISYRGADLRIDAIVISKAD
jgi:hypothetical protein